MKRPDPASLGLLALAAALNIALGSAVGFLKLPVYLDSVGTILAAALGGWPAGVAVGLLGVLASTLLVAPTSWAYAGTAMAIAVLADQFARRGYLKKIPVTIAGGLAIGIVSAMVSAPVTTYFYGGVSFAGADAATAYFSAMGKTLLESVLLGGVATDPVDKLASSVIAFLILKALPRTIIARAPHSERFEDAKEGPKTA